MAVVCDGQGVSYYLNQHPVDYTVLTLSLDQALTLDRCDKFNESQLHWILFINAIEKFMYWIEFEFFELNLFFVSKVDRENLQEGHYKAYLKPLSSDPPIGKLTASFINYQKY